jgi:hypothetical protein
MEIKKIAVVTFFFGELPWYFRFFQQSCAANPTVDFIFFTDNKPTEATPPNLQFHYFTLPDFNRLATQRLGFTIDIQKGYKVCDLRPAFGVIFEAYLTDYDWWGYTDIDIIFGRIREFMTEELLDSHDVISVKDEYPTGYFMLLKNSPQVNTLYTLSKDYKAVFTAPHNMLFEECGGYYTEVCNGINILDTDCPFETFYHVLEKEKDRIRSFFDYLVMERTPGLLKWDKGVLGYRNEFEVLLYHLSDYKLNVFSRKKYWTTLPPTYFIDAHNFRKPSPLGSLMRWWTDQFHPAMVNRIRRWDMWLAARWFRKPMKQLRSGEYYYMKDKVTVKVNAKGQNEIYYASMQQPFVLLSLLFTKHHFFNPDTRRIYRDEGHNFSEIFKDGNLIVYTHTKDIE